MTTEELISTLTVLVLIAFLIALIYLIVILHRANSVIAKFDSLSTIFRSFVSDIVPAIVNVGTLMTAVQSILRQLSNHHEQSKSTKKKS